MESCRGCKNSGKVYQSARRPRKCGQTPGTATPAPRSTFRRPCPSAVAETCSCHHPRPRQRSIPCLQSASMQTQCLQPLAPQMALPTRCRSVFRHATSTNSRCPRAPTALKATHSLVLPRVAPTSQSQLPRRRQLKSCLLVYIFRIGQCPLPTLWVYPECASRDQEAQGPADRLEEQAERRERRRDGVHVCPHDGQEARKVRDPLSALADASDASDPDRPR